MRLFHGTTMSGLTHLYYHTGIKVCKPWCVESEDFMYFYDPNITESWESKYPPCESPIDAAFRSAKIQSCYTQDTAVVVIECEIPDELVVPDISFDGAQDLYKQILIKDFKFEYVKDIHRKEVNPYTKPEIAMGFFENGLANLDALPKDLRKYIEEVRFVHVQDIPRHIIEREYIDAEPTKRVAIREVDGVKMIVDFVELP